jgi:hypothetical protein
VSDPLELGAQAKRRDAVLRETRSLFRRADKLRRTVADLDDNLATQIASSACEEIEKLVHYLVRLDRRPQRRIDWP